MIIEGIDYSPKGLADFGLHTTQEKLDWVIGKIGSEDAETIPKLRNLKNLLGVFMTLAMDLLDVAETFHEAASETSESEEIQGILQDLKEASDNVTQHSDWSKIIKVGESPDKERCRFISDTIGEIFDQYFGSANEVFDFLPLGERSEPNKPSAVAQPIS